MEPDLPSVVRNACFETNSIVKQLNKGRTPQQALQLLERLRSLKYEYPDVGIISRSIARLHARLGDSNTAFTELKSAIALGGNDIRSRMVLGRLAHDEQNYHLAFECYAGIKTMVGWDPIKTDELTVRYCCNGLLIALLYLGENEKILTETQNWDENPCVKDLNGAFRARAWKRSVEKNPSLEKKALALKKAVNILDEISKLYGYARWTYGAFHEVIEEIVVCAGMQGFSSAKEAIHLLKFVDHHLTNVYKDEGNDRATVLEFANTLRNVVILDNPFKDSEWTEFLQTGGGQIYVDAEFKDNLKHGDFIFVTVYHIPKQGGPFVFAEDDSGRQYFIHLDVVGQSSRARWMKLDERAQLAIRVQGNSPRDKAHPASEAHIL